jgi:restriction system protein
VLYNSKVFPEQRPAAPVDQEAPEEPNRDDPSFKHVEEFDVVGEFWSLLLPGVKRKRASAAQSKRDAAQQRYDSGYRSWQNAKLEIARQNARARAMFDIALDEWWVKAQAFQKQQQEENAQIEKFRLRYGRKEPDAVIEFLDAVLSHAEYPDAFPMHWEMDFQPETGILIVDYELPPPDDFPRLKAVKYDVVRDTFVQNYWSAPEIAQLYEGAAFQTCLRTLHGLFAADKENVLASVTFNGWANFTDRVHGRPARVCVMSVQASKAEIARADLRKVDPKIAFKSLKGIAGTRLADMTAVVPVLSMKGSDARPVAANDVMAREARPPNSQDRA